MVRDFISKKREVMATSMKSLFLFVTAGLTMLVFLPEAKARGRMGMTMVRPQMTTAPNMMNGNMNSNMSHRMGMQPSLTPPGSNGGVFNPRFNRGRFDRFEDQFERRFGDGRFDRFEDRFENRSRFGRFDSRFNRWWWPGGLVLGYGGYGGLDALNLYAPADGSQNSIPTSPRRTRQAQSTPTLTPEQERERIHQEELAWSRSDLPDNQITSATALNILLTDLQSLQTRGIQGPEVKIDQAILPSLNVVVNGRNGNIGVLKDEGRINWPVALSGTDFEVERLQIESSIPKAIDEAVNAEAVAYCEIVKPQAMAAALAGGLTISSTDRALASMRFRLAAKIKETPTSEYIRAKRFLNQLDDAVRLLRQPDAGNYFNQTYAAKGQTVTQLVQYMTRHGLQFAPAVEGDEPAYVALHQALAEYDLAANSQGSAKGRTSLNSKSETRNPKQFQMTKGENPKPKT
jgi:hypothetical protein